MLKVKSHLKVLSEPPELRLSLDLYLQIFGIQLQTAKDLGTQDLNLLWIRFTMHQQVNIIVLANPRFHCA